MLYISYIPPLWGCDLQGMEACFSHGCSIHGTLSPTLVPTCSHSSVKVGGHQQISTASQQATWLTDPTSRAASRDKPWPTESGMPQSMEGTQCSGGRDFRYLRLLSMGPEVGHWRLPSAPILKNQIHYPGSQLVWKPLGCQAQIWGGHLGNRSSCPAGQGQGGRGRGRHNQGHENTPRCPEEGWVHRGLTLLLGSMEHFQNFHPWSFRPPARHCHSLSPYCPAQSMIKGRHPGNGRPN